ncbi:MAG: glycoside hydrolase family 43 protein [Clostridia bacterium]|nr:glycoside hydrolase family 43 protein [Clostridia bacterium]
MKFLKILFCFILVPFILAGCTGGTEDTVTDDNILTEIKNGSSYVGYSYQNKILGGVADPFILEYRGKYYLYSTGGSKFHVRTSTDLVNWTTQEEPILRLSDTTWAKEKGWAPEIYEYNDKFYFIFSAAGEDGIHSIDIAVCDTPNGHFKPLFKQAFYSPEYSVIDASLFFDDDGRVYMYYSKDCSTNYVNGKRTSQTWGIELEKDLSGTIGEPVLISTPYQDWELKSGDTLWNEGPVVFKENGAYYLLYSANYYARADYSVGYAISDSPLQMFYKPDDACILTREGNSITGPGHCNILRSADGTELYMVYHVHTVAPNTDGGRSLAIDRILFNEDGSLSVDGPSSIRRPLPSGTNGFYHLKDGFTVAGNVDYSGLFNGIVKESDSNMCFVESGSSVEITFDEPQNLYALMIYSSPFSQYTPDVISVEINGEYIISDCTSPVYGGELSVAIFENLPADTLVESVKMTFTAEKEVSHVFLSEIMMITR